MEKLGKRPYFFIAYPTFNFTSLVNAFDGAASLLSVNSGCVIAGATNTENHTMCMLCIYSFTYILNN